MNDADIEPEEDEDEFTEYRITTDFKYFGQ